MSRPLKLALRSMAIVAALTAFAIIFAPPAAKGSPYASALSNIGVTSAQAGGGGGHHCTNDICVEINYPQAQCQPYTGWHCKGQTGANCILGADTECNP